MVTLGSAYNDPYARCDTIKTKERMQARENNLPFINLTCIEIQTIEAAMSDVLCVEG